MILGWTWTGPPEIMMGIMFQPIKRCPTSYGPSPSYTICRLQPRYTRVPTTWRWHFDDTRPRNAVGPAIGALLCTVQFLYSGLG
jgi:hypothetical protein